MRIEVRGRHVAVSEQLRSDVQRRFEKIARQVSPLAELELELHAERNQANPRPMVAAATLRLKGVTLRAEDASHDLTHAIHLCAEALAVQVERHRAKRRRRREAARAQALQRSAQAA